METHRQRPPRNTRCDCGEKAICETATGSICERCNRIEQMMYGGHGTRTGGFDFAMQATEKHLKTVSKYMRWCVFHTPVHWTRKQEEIVLSSFNH